MSSPKKKKAAQKSRQKKVTVQKKSSKIIFAELNAVSTKYWRLAVGLILLVAALVRFGHLQTIYNSDLSEIYAWTELDSEFFDRWGSQISDGDIKSLNIGHPYHGWHRAVASYAIPENDIVNDPVRLDKRAKEIWTSWYGQNKFHQEPLYPYFIATIYSLFGHRPYLIFILQVLGSLLSIYLLMCLTRKLFNDWSGILAGAMFAIYGPAVFADGLMLRASLIILLLIAFTYVFMRWMDSKAGKPSFGSSIGLGVMVGLNLLMKFSTLVPIVLCFGFWAWKNRSKVKIQLGQVAVVILTSLLMLLPAVIRNISVGAPPFSLSSVGAITYINSNVPEYPMYDGFIIDFERSASVMAKSEGQLLSTVGNTIGTHDGLGSFLGLQIKKLGCALHNVEIANNFNFYYFNKVSSWLDLAFLRFYLIFGFALMGIIMAWRSGRGLNLLHIMLFGQLFILVAFYVLWRFRLPFAVMLLPFAGYALQTLLAEVFQKKYRSLAWTIIAIIGILFSLRPLGEDYKMFRPSDVSVPFMSKAQDRMQTLAESEDLKGVLDLYEEYLDICPPKILTLSKDNPPITFSEKGLSSFYQKLYKNSAGICKELGLKEKRKEYAAINKQMRQANKAGGN